MKYHSIQKKKNPFALIYWPETYEISIVSLSDILKVIKTKSVQVGWVGDLPWTNEISETTIYEAKLLKISCNQNYLQSIIVDNWGRIIKPEIPTAIMAAKKEIAKEKKARKTTEKQGLNKLNSKVQHIRDINEAIEKPATNTQAKESVEIMEEHPGTSESARQSDCENCKKCICRDLNIQISPDFVRLLKAHTDLLTLMMSKKYPEGMPQLNTEIELYPGTNVMISSNDLITAVSNANKNKRALIRNLFVKIVKTEDIVKYGTEKKLTADKPEISQAIIGYITKRYKTEITSTEFNDVVNRKMRDIIIDWNKKNNITTEKKASAKNKRSHDDDSACSKTKKSKKGNGRSSLLVSSAPRSPPHSRTSSPSSASRTPSPSSVSRISSPPRSRTSSPTSPLSRKSRKPSPTPPIKSSTPPAAKSSTSSSSAPMIPLEHSANPDVHQNSSASSRTSQKEIDQPMKNNLPFSDTFWPHSNHRNFHYGPPQYSNPNEHHYQNYPPQYYYPQNHPQFFSEYGYNTQNNNFVNHNTENQNNYVNL